MKGVNNKVWALMAKYIVNEASAEEKLIFSSLAVENEELRTIFKELLQYYRVNEPADINDPAPAFEKLNERIKNLENL